MKSGLGTSETHAQLLPIIKFVGEFFSEMASSQVIRFIPYATKNQMLIATTLATKCRKFWLNHWNQRL